MGDAAGVGRGRGGADASTSTGDAGMMDAVAVDIFVRSASALYVCTRADQARGMPHQNARLGGVSALGMSARCRVARERTRSRECQRGEGKVEDAIAL